MFIYIYFRGGWAQSSQAQPIVEPILVVVSHNFLDTICRVNTRCCVNHFMVENKFIYLIINLTLWDIMLLCIYIPFGGIRIKKLKPP